MTEIIQFTYLATVLISAIFSLRAFRLKWPQPYKFFSWFLFTAIATEVAATLWVYDIFGFGKIDPFKTNNNAWIISFMLLPQYLVYITVYYRLLTGHKLRKYIITLAAVYVLFWALNICAWEGLTNINSYTHILASVIMLFLVFAYFEQIRGNDKLITLKEEPFVWISLGNFIYHLITIPFLFTINYLNNLEQTEKNIETGESFYIFYLLTLIITYSLYIKAFLCPHPQQK